MLMRAISCIALVAPAALTLAGCVSSAPLSRSPPPSPSNREVQPVVMSPRTIQPPATQPDGERIQLRDGDLPFLLFLPAGWSHATNCGRLAIHFHTADWFAVDEHLRAGYRFPLVTVLLGSGSARYRGPFLDTERFPRLLKLVEAEQARRGVIKPRVQTVDVSSFSAGYGAVRELVQQPAAFRLIRRLVLSDSLYAGLATGAGGQGTRVVQKDHVECWLPFARAAVCGKKSFVFTYSEILPAAYASTGECAAAILVALGLKPLPVRVGCTPAADELDYPLRLRADCGRLHFWGYAGSEPGAHLVHPRHLADVWTALDAAP